LIAHIELRSAVRSCDCYDNSVAESFFATLKKELVHRQTFPTRRELTSEVFEYIEAFSNPTRRPPTLWMLSPAQFESLAPPTTRTTRLTPESSTLSGQAAELQCLGRRVVLELLVGYRADEHRISSQFRDG
jgi:hypothetical protein